MTVVSDASPIIALDRIGRLNLLSDLYGTVLVPSAVERELLAPSSFQIPKWVEVRTLGSIVPQEVQNAGLGAGESEAIALAVETGATLLLLDDRGARKLARALSLSVVGVGGILVAAKRLHLLDSVAAALDALVADGFRIAPRLREELLRLANETGG